MSWNPYLRNNDQIANSPYTTGGYEKEKLRKLLLIVVGVFFAIAILILIVHVSQPESQQTKYTKSATAAARKQTPNAKVTDVKVADGFALAIVSDPTAQGQANSGNTTVFKVNKDGSMVQIANGSYFGPLDLLQLGMPLATQAKLTGKNIGQVKQDLANQCGYSDGTLGYNGFGGSFGPGGLQIDAATLSDIKQKLSNTIENQNINVKPGKAVICVNAVQKNSNFITNRTTYTSTFSLQVQFLTSDGTLTTHPFTFSFGPNYSRNYTLDGKTI